MQVNVAKKSDNGHFVEKAVQVVCLDEVTESYVVKGPSILTTKNHTTLPMEENCFISPQQVYNPLAGMMERVTD